MASVTLIAQDVPNAGEKERLLDVVLKFEKEIVPDVDVKKCRRVVSELVTRCRQRLSEARRDSKGSITPEQTIAVLSEVLLKKRGMKYRGNKSWRDGRLHSMLLQKRGNCLSASLLYHVVAEELGLPVQITFTARHAMARWDDGKSVHLIETTAGGKIIPFDQVLKAQGLTKSDLQPNLFLCKTSKNETVAVLETIWCGVMASLGRERRARELLELAAKHAPGWTEPGRIRIWFARREGRHEKMKQYIEAYAKKAKGPLATTELLLCRAEYCLATGRSLEALSLLKKGLAGSRPAAKLRIKRKIGGTHLMRREFKEAIAAFREVADSKVTWRACWDLAAAYAAAGQYDRAIRACEKLLKLKRGDTLTIVMLAGLHERKGDRKRGRQLFSSVKKPRVYFLDWRRSLIWYYAVIGNQEKMLVNIQAALKMDKSSRTYYYLLTDPALDPYRRTPSFIKLLKSSRWSKGKKKGEKTTARPMPYHSSSFSPACPTPPPGSSAACSGPLACDDVFSGN